MKYLGIAIFYLAFIGMLLYYPQNALEYAYQGLVQWATRMVPTLFPFMMISSMMIHTGIDIYLAKILRPILKPFFACSTNGIYAIFMGFLCGFPMGAKATCDLTKENKITKKEAEYLLAFCNNIGPTYFLGIIFPMLQGCGYSSKLPFLLGIYGIPLLYGVLLGKIFKKNIGTSNTETNSIRTEETKKTSISTAIRLSCQGSIQSILLLGGYVTFINAFRVIPDILNFSTTANILTGSFLEIIHGIPSIYNHRFFPSTWKAFWIMVSLSFSGICCMLQTYSILSETAISMKKYILHKCVITGISVAYYFIVLSLV